MAADVRTDPSPRVVEAANDSPKPVEKGGGSHYKGFVAGVFSGVTKLTGKQHVVVVCVMRLGY